MQEIKGLNENDPANSCEFGVNDAGTSAIRDTGLTQPCSPTVRSIDKLPLTRLREVLAYNPETGDLLWRVRLSPRCYVGKPAGKTTTGGYRRISIDGVSYTASHLAWFHHYGVPPVGLLDHENTDQGDNRIDNLRPATHSQNSQNIGVRSNSSTGLKGASRFNSPRNNKKFRSSITVDGCRIHLGQFHTAEEAHAAYSMKAAELHGKFARTEKPQEITMTNPIAALRAQSRELRRRCQRMPEGARPHTSNLIEQISNCMNEADIERLKPFMAKSSRLLAAALQP